MELNLESTSRQVERPLRIDLFQRNYSTIFFDIKQAVPALQSSSSDPRTQFLEFVEVPSIQTNMRPKKLTISCGEHVEESDDGLEEDQTYRRHILTEIDRAVDDEGTLADVEIVGASWKVDLDDGDMKTVYEEGLVYHLEGETVRPLEEVIRQCAASGNHDDPFAVDVTVCLPLGEGAEITLDIQIEYDETMVMFVTTPLDASIGLRFRLSMIQDAEGRVERGSLEVMSRGLSPLPVREVVFLPELVFIMWLIYSDEYSSRFERWT